MKIRDETCRFPGCSRRADRCDVDHVEDWAHGGTTSHDNLIHLCRKHHRLKHTSRWRPRSGGAAAGRGSSGDVHVDGSAARGTGGAEGTRGAEGTDSSSRPDAAHVTDDSPCCGSSGCPDGSTVSWDAPSGRSYVDHAAVSLQAPRRDTGETTSRVAGLGRQGRAAMPAHVSITEGSTFDGPPPF
ncbi:HNH endonuclease signature motif containing protein [Sanguibacter biliveldensis]|uniref:HNH endonuclease signature motif containing protein n=1 Tax=Sanguibacter biliveldensis TaxID=3030830 RepID=UPI0029C0417C|nr:HNH endonuclease signature motif containing protein [Sanguibacter sp. 4.1]